MEFFGGSGGDKWVRQSTAGPSGLRAEPGEGGLKRGEVTAFKSPATIGGAALFTQHTLLSSKYRVTEAACPGSTAVKKTTLALLSLSKP